MIPREIFNVLINDNKRSSKAFLKFPNDNFLLALLKLSLVFQKDYLYLIALESVSFRNFYFFTKR